MPADVFDSAACALAVTGEDGTILKANARFGDWLGFSTAELCADNVGGAIETELTIADRVGELCPKLIVSTGERQCRRQSECHVGCKTGA